MRVTTVVLGAVFVLVGLLWTGQGLGYLPGSVMSGVRLWAIVGPVVAIVGIVLVVRGLKRRGGPRAGDGSSGG